MPVKKKRTKRRTYKTARRSQAQVLGGTGIWSSILKFAKKHNLFLVDYQVFLGFYPQDLIPPLKSVQWVLPPKVMVKKEKPDELNDLVEKLLVELEQAWFVLEVGLKEQGLAEVVARKVTAAEVIKEVGEKKCSHKFKCKNFRIH